MIAIVNCTENLGTHMHHANGCAQSCGCKLMDDPLVWVLLQGLAEDDGGSDLEGSDNDDNAVNVALSLRSPAGKVGQQASLHPRPAGRS